MEKAQMKYMKKNKKYIFRIKYDKINKILLV